MGVFRGSAALLWVDSDDQTTERVLLLREPLRELRPAHQQSVFVAESLDQSQRQIFTVGEGADELVGKVRYADDAQGLMDFIKAGSKLRTVTYVPNLGDADRRYACYLIAPLSPTALGMDADAGVDFGLLEVEIRLRKTDRTPFADTWKKDLLFSWRAGGRMEEATFSRAGVASYAALAGGGGYGTLSTGAAAAARTHWMSTASSKGPRTFPTLLLEEQRTNFALQSENLGSATWTKIGGLIATTGQADPRGGTGAALINDNTTANGGTARETINITAPSTIRVLSGFIRRGTTSTTVLTPNSRGVLRLLTTAGTQRIGIGIKWSSDKPVLTVETGVAIGVPEKWRGGWWRIQQRSTGNLTTGNYLLDWIPAAGTTGAGFSGKGNMYVFAAQVE